MGMDQYKKKTHMLRFDGVTVPMKSIEIGFK